MKCYFHDDLDGHCAGAIIKQAYPKCEMIAVDYRRDFPIWDIKTDERVFIVDYSLQKPGEFDALIKLTGNIIWIDHHKTAIEQFPHLNKLPGIRDISKAGCVLTWEALHPGEKMPEAVKFIGDRDIWAWKYLETEWFCAGMNAENTLPESEIWQELLDTNLDNGVAEDAQDKLIHKGHIITNYRKKDNANRMTYAYKTVFENYDCIALNHGHGSSMIFDSLNVKYDIYICYFYDGKKWNVSLYSTAIDVSEIAKKYGGGGHAGASGFQCEKLPF